MANNLAVLVYHKNASKLYPKKWLDQFVNSICEQTYKQFDILELDYGGGNERLFTQPGFSSAFYSDSCNNFIYGLNFLISEAKRRGYIYIANTNCDDYYSKWRFELQIGELKRYDVVSSNFSLVSEDKGVSHTHKFDHLDLKKELARNHNIICHPSVMYRSEFFDDFEYDPNEILNEDLKLWQRAIDHKKFIIRPEVLCFHRIHNQAVCRSKNR